MLLTWINYLREMAEATDANGFNTFWLMDHFYQVDRGFGPKGDPMLEGYTTLSYLAAVTQKIPIGVNRMHWKAEPLQCGVR